MYSRVSSHPPRVLRALFAGALLLAAIPSAAHVNVFGPKTYTPSQGAPQTVTESITLAGPCDLTPNAQYVLVVASDGVASASIRVNGTEVVKESDFNQQVSTIERSVTLAATNTLGVTIKGGSHSGSLTISIRRHIDLTEAVFAEKTFTTTGKSNQFSASFNAVNQGNFEIIVRNGATAVKSGSVRLNGVEVVTEKELKDSAVVRKSVTLAASNQLVIDTKSDGAGASLSVAVVRHLVDTAGPQIVHGLTEGQIIGATPHTISGNVTDASGVAAFAINGAPVAIGGGGAFSRSVALVEGQNTIVFDATDCEGNATHREVHVVLELAPKLVVLSPANHFATQALTIPLNGTASATGGIASVTANGQPMTMSGASWSGSLTFSSEGVKTITVVATDTSNRSTTVTLEVIVDQTQPALTMTMPSPSITTMYVGIAPVGGYLTDPLSGPGAVICNGTPAVLGGDGSYSCDVALQLGANTIVVTGRDQAGNTTSLTRSISYSPDTVRPTISATVTPPPNAEGWVNAFPTVRFECADDRVVPLCTSPMESFREGANQIFSGTAADQAGNEATVTVTVSVDNQPPVVEIPLTDNAIVTNSTARITGTATDATSGVKNLMCNGVATPVGSGGAFDCSVALSSAGWQYVPVVATDVAGNQRTSRVQVHVDKQPPSLEITSPAGNIATSTRTVDIEGIVNDDDAIAAVTVNGVPAAVNSGGFFATVSLADGDNNITVRATDRAGNFSTATVTVRSFIRPAIRIIQPADFAVTSSSTIPVSGTVSGSVAAVDVNGIAATISGTSFTAANVPLQQGRTVITATVRATNGQLATDDLNVYRDSIPPRVQVYSPAIGSIVTSSPINVSGMVDDIVIGTVNAGQVTVRVNNTAATVSNRAFLASNIALQPGANTLTIVATDRAGNATTITHNVTYNATGARILPVSGNGQTAAIGAPLAQPLKVRLLDASGAAAAAKSVTFTILQNDGALAAGTTTGRELSVTTNSLGEATVNWTLGHRAGAGNNRVRATAAGFAGVVEFTARANAGTPAMVVVDMGNNQYGVSNETLPRPLVAVVVDGGSNRLANVPVTFSVIAGGGSINGLQGVIVNTDSDGRALVKPRLGPGVGYDNNTFAATVAGITQGAVFKSTGRAGGPASETTISGVVLDNTNIPIQGVTIRIDETSRSTQSDARGQFTLTNAPVGYVKLIVEGSTAQRPGTWPMLEFIMYTNPGQNNTIGMPIYLLPIDVTRGIQITETTGGTLTIPELPGFSLKVAPGSALFPSGSRAGTISATLVHNDKVPMTPGFGQQPRFIVTIQPPGVHFDPPAALTMPNVDGLAPGEVTEMYSFDHDLGQFVAIGTGSCSEDGTTIVSDPGVGIIKSGWHCSGNPNPTGSSACMTITGEVEVPEQPLEEPTLRDGPQFATQSIATSERRLISHATASMQTAPVAGCVIVTGKGSPGGSNFRYSGWSVSDDTIADLGQPSECPSLPKCTAKVTGKKEGIVSVFLKYVNSSTGDTAQDEVKVQFVNFQPTVDELTVNGDIEIIEDIIVQPPPPPPPPPTNPPQPPQPPPPLQPQLNAITDPIWKSANTATQNKPVMITPADNLTLLVKFKLPAPLPAPLPKVGFKATVLGGGMTGSFVAKAQTIPANTLTFDVQFKGKLTGFQSQMVDLTFLFEALPPTDCPFATAAGTVNVTSYTAAKRVTFPVYRTTLHIAAQGTQIALNNQNQLQAKVWDKFGTGTEPFNVKNWRNEGLFYYPATTKFGNNPTDEKELVQYKLGRCGAFAELMGHALALNGVAATLINVVPNSAVLPPGKAADEKKGMLVKNWSFATTGSVTNQGAYKWIWVTKNPAQANEMYEPPDPQNPTVYGEVTSNIGVKGQGTATPQEKAHYNHAIIRIGSTYYDPSYGATYANKTEFESKSLDGYLNFKIPSGLASPSGQPATGIASQTGQGVRFMDWAQY